MSAVYAESSAVLAWLLGESGASEVLRRINGADTIVTSALTILETERALIRAEKLNLLSAGNCQRLRGLFARTVASWVLMEVTEEVRAAAARVFPAEPVRTLDALHLATALLFAGAFPDLQVLTLDRRLAGNAVALGIG